MDMEFGSDWMTETHFHCFKTAVERAWASHINSYVFPRASVALCTPVCWHTDWEAAAGCQWKCVTCSLLYLLACFWEESPVVLLLASVFSWGWPWLQVLYYRCVSSYSIKGSNPRLGACCVSTVRIESSSAPQCKYLTSHEVLPAGCPKQFAPVVSKKRNLWSQKLKCNTARCNMFIIQCL